MQKELFDFSVALQKMKLGYRVCREGWGWGAGYDYLQIIYPNTTNIETNFLYPFIAQGNQHIGYMPWETSYIDILSDDWCLYAEPVKYEDD